MKRAFSIIAMLLSLCSLSYAADYYISPTGTDAPTSGTWDAPYKTANYALGQKGGGHTYHFAPGEYPTLPTKNVYIPTTAKGSPTARTILVSDTPRAAIIKGSPGHCITSEGGCDYVTIDGFVADGAVSDGIKINGAYQVIKNCLVRNCPGQGVSIQGQNYGTVEGNTIEDCGTDSMTHGMYINGVGHVIRKNIVRRCKGSGLQLYGTFTDGIVEWNTVIDNLRFGIIIGNGARNKVRYNTIRNCFGPLRLYTPAAGNEIKYNVFEGGYSVPTWVDGTGDWSGVILDYNTWHGQPGISPAMTNVTFGIHNIVSGPGE